MDTTDTEAPTLLRGNIDSLIAAMPSLLRKGAPSIKAPGDCTAFEAWAKGACFSTGERCAAAFVLHVWNRHAKHRAPWRFDFGLAMNTWDGQHLATFASWARSPWYC